jgi:GNAT superfamily N-acetyltransferase
VDFQRLHLRDRGDLLNFAIEPIKDCWKEFVTLAELCWIETGEDRCGYPFNPSLDIYQRYNESGFYVFCTARDEGRLVGYAGIYLTPSMRTQKLMATEDSFYLLKEYRAGRNAVNLYRFVEQECRKRNAVEMGMTGREEIGRILKRLGYEMINQQYHKSLNGAHYEHLVS